MFGLPDPIDLPYTLIEFCEKVQPRLDRESTMLADTVRMTELGALSAALKKGQPLRDKLDAMCAVAAHADLSPVGHPEMMMGKVYLPPKNGGIWAADVKKRNRELYEASRVPITRLHIAAPQGEAAIKGLPRLTRDAFQSVDAFNHRQRIKNNQVANARGRLLAEWDEAGLNDGIFYTSDGFRIGVTRVKNFRSQELIALVGADDAAKYRIDKEYERQWYWAKMLRDEAHMDSVERDEIEGDLGSALARWV